MTQISIKDIAKRADVSIATVSRVLNNMGNVKPATAAKVREAMAYYHFEPNQNARALVGAPTRTIGVYGPGTSFSRLFENGYSLELLKGQTDHISEMDYSLYMINETPQSAASSSVPAYHRYIRQNRIDGLLLLSVASDKAARSSLDELRRENFPFVYAGERINSSDLNVYAHFNDYTEDVIRRFAEAGHRKILYLAPADSASRRMGAIVRKMLKQYPDLSVKDVFMSPGLSQEEYTGRLRQYITEEGFTAVFSTEGSITNKLLFHLSSLRIRIPEDISVIGIVHSTDDLKETYPVNAYLVPAREMGRELAKLLIEKIQDPVFAPRQTDFQPVYYDHGSVSSL